MPLRRNTLLNILGSSLPLVVAFVAMPLLLNGLGSKQFGLLTVLWALIGYFGFLDMGIGKALTYEVSRNCSGDRQTVAEIVTAGLFILMIGGGIGLALLGLTISTPLVGLLHLDNIPEAHACLWYAVIGILPTCLASGLRGVMEGQQRFIASNVFKNVSALMLYLAPLVSVRIYGPSIEWAVKYTVAARFLAVAIGILQIRRLLVPVSIVTVKGCAARFVRYGSMVTVSSVVSPIMSYMDRLALTATGSVAQLAFYTIPQEVLIRLLIVPSGLSATLMPVIAGETNLEKNWHLLAKTTRIVGITLLGFSIVAALSAKSVLALWMGGSFAESSYSAFLILLPGFCFCCLSQIIITYLQGIGCVSTVARVHFYECLAYIAIGYTAIYHWGIYGAAITWSGRLMIEFCIFWHLARKSRVAGANQPATLTTDPDCGKSAVPHRV
jgi:O-antigen/teichoic acid export membrane protein